MSGSRVSVSEQSQLVFYIVAVLHFKKGLAWHFGWVNTLAVASMFSDYKRNQSKKNVLRNNVLIRLFDL